KCDVWVMAVHAYLRELRVLQTGVQHAGLDVVDSYVSLSEVSEYAAQMPDEMKKPRLPPTIPPSHVDYAMPAWCFYPMSKKRGVDANWFTLPYERRSELMHEHEARGRKFAGRVGQYIHRSAAPDQLVVACRFFS